MPEPDDKTLPQRLRAAISGLFATGKDGLTAEYDAGLTWGHLRALLAELEMYRQQDQQD